MSNKDVDPQVVTGGDKSAASRLRLLDFDDLFLLGHLLEGSTIAATAKQLGLTQPAITQRVRKIERVFAETILVKVGRHVRLTKEGRAICVRAADALSLMRAVTSEPAGSALTIGAEPLAATSMLIPAAMELRESKPESLYHLAQGGAEELAALLDTGGIDAWVTSRPYSGGLHGVADIGDMEYVFVARPDLAAAITSPAALAATTLLELDRSYPLLARLDAATRASVRFRQVWFLSQAAAVLTAAQQGHGVAILPEPLVTAGLSSGKLGVVLPEFDLAGEAFRLIYRHDRVGDVLVGQMVARLQARIREQ